MNQKLPLSLFVYNSASDNDGYAQQKFCYKLTTTGHWLADPASLG